MTTNGVLTTVITFDYNIGADPRAGLLLANDGAFYGVAASGGWSGGGTLFKLTANGAFMSLVNFSSSQSSGYTPVSALMQAADGALYGTTTQGGASQLGAVFKLAGTLSVVTSFTKEGINPASGLLQASDGNLYGTTAQGGRRRSWHGL